MHELDKIPPLHNKLKNLYFRNLSVSKMSRTGGKTFADVVYPSIPPRETGMLKVMLCIPVSLLERREC